LYQGVNALADTKSFAPFHPWDRTFFAVFVLACWLGVGMGFAPASIGRLQGKADYTAPLILHIHAMAFIGWLLLLTAQAFLIRAGRTATHRKSGMVAVLLIPVMVLSGIISEVYSQRFYLAHPPNSLDFFIIPIFYVVAFGILASMAVVKRKEQCAHKRLILLATTIIVGAAYARWLGDGLEKAFGDGYLGMILNTFTGTNLIMLAAIAYDLATRQRLHPVYMFGVPAILASEITVSLIYHSPTWVEIARGLVTP
jgi:uncharacterized membrane protein YozB (DUF420 family)